jgi:hypothetical protein
MYLYNHSIITRAVILFSVMILVTVLGHYFCIIGKGYKMSNVTRLWLGKMNDKAIVNVLFLRVWLFFRMHCNWMTERQLENLDSVFKLKLTTNTNKLAICFWASEAIPSIIWNLNLYYRVYKKLPLVPPEPEKSSPHASRQLILRWILIVTSHLRLGLLGGLFPALYPTQIV